MRGANETKALALVGAVVLGFFALGWAAESQAAGIAALVIAAAFILGLTVYTMRRAKQVVDVALDEGGLRIDARSGARSYLPFEELRGASTRSAFGGALLELTSAAGPRRLVLDREVPPAVVSGLHDGIARPRSVPSGLESLARAGQPLDAWLLRLRDRAVPDYRERPIDPEALLATFEDRAAPVELRAAAAHMLLWLRDHDHASRVIAGVGPATPPLVVVAATLATKLGTYVPGYDDALGYLTPADRAVAVRLIDERPAIGRTRIAGEPETEDEAEGLDEEARRAHN